MVNPLRLSDDRVVTLIVFGGVAAVAGGVGLVNWLVTRRRRQAYEAFCRDRGYRFDRERPGEETHHAATCRLFTEGHGRRWTFTIVGTSGWSSSRDSMPAAPATSSCGGATRRFRPRTLSTISSWKARACAARLPKASSRRPY